ncbi:MAG: imidazolonepropionase [Geminicoccaceae bacterium]|nr:MAG: imidazolonepropionase [Geminicoccaceae bacterium]
MDEDGTVFTAARVATMVPGNAPYGLLEDAAFAVSDGWIVWLGPEAALPAHLQSWPRTEFGDTLVTPALIDAHTHIVHGGNRAREFALRLEGASYAAIARAGGGILSTVEATRQASVDGLVAAALPRLDALLDEGVATIEVKSGYGLDLETERRMLVAARHMAEHRAVRVRTSFLGAHALPPEFQGEADRYIDFVVKDVLPALADDGLIDAVDGFLETIAFDAAQIERVFQAAVDLGLPVKLHADQLSDGGGGVLAARFNALSADHLEYLNPSGVAAMAAAGTVAMLLPGAYYTLRETRTPPVAALRAAGVPMAVATDCNPGSSPLTSLLLAMNMACTLFRLTPEEALAGTTRIAAKALGIDGEVGTLEVGKRADFAVYAVEDPAELSYRIGFNPLVDRFVGGLA